MKINHAVITIPLLLSVLVIHGCAPRPISPLKVQGLWHKVKDGDSVDKIAKKYGANPDIIAELNDIPSQGAIANRNEIFIPKAGGKPPGTGVAPKPNTVVATNDQLKKTSLKVSSLTGKCKKPGKSCFQWPVDGTLTSSFGTHNKKQNDGLDIVAPTGTPIKAAADGQVLYSGDQIKGYGNMVLVRHDNGIITVYAHNDKNLVSEGDRVTRGQEIAKVGSTGSATTNHLHFEVRVNEQPMDPLLFLPGKN